MTSTELDLDDHHDPWPSIALEDDYYYSLLVIVTQRRQFHILIN
jgi:hypothetical protein